MVGRFVTGFLRLLAVTVGVGALHVGSTTASPPAFLSAEGPVTAVWANDGGNKITREELRARFPGRPIISRLWDGKRIALFGARNEVVSANLVLEAADGPASDISVEFDRLAGPEGFLIRSLPLSDKNDLFKWVDRDIERFLVGYLQVKGLSVLAYDTMDERFVPERMRLPRTSDGKHAGVWADRPDHDKYYPDVAIPLELSPSFSIEGGRNQSVWIDIYIPKQAPAGRYTGEILVKERDTVRYAVPVELDVRNFALPDVPASKTMIYTTYDQVAPRYTGVEFPSPGSPEDALARRVLDRQFLIAHRHKVSLIDDNGGAGSWSQDRPRPDWMPRLSGELFTPTNGYKGPGEGVGNNVYSIGTYGTWRDLWGEPSPETLWPHADNWQDWFRFNFPDTEYFLYLIDESTDYAQTERWARLIADNPGIGRNLPSFATASLPQAAKYAPSLDIVASILASARTPWQPAVDRVFANPMKRLFLYNGMRPASGTFTIEDDGIALRELAWGQWKLGVDRWFYWESTYYNDFQSGRGPTNVFTTAQTFGKVERADRVLGVTGWNATNGDGVLFYPGTDAVFPEESYNIEGPIASLRMKQWRRGVQDVDYLALASELDPIAAAAIVQRMVPKVLWQVREADPASSTPATSWSDNPDDWEAARAELADIIERGVPQSREH
jgi:hypothetical protein